MVKKFALLLCLATVLGLLGAPASARVIEVRITSGADDAEEHLDDGRMELTSTDLEFPYEDNANPKATDPQLTALRFNPIAIPQGATITKAYLEFEVDENKGNDKPVNVIIEGQLVPDAPAITSAARNLSSREPLTTAKVKWTVPMGLVVNAKFQSPDISAVLNEIVGQKDWVSGNALLLLIRDDPENPSLGLRCVESVEGERDNAPLLYVEVVVAQATDPDPANGAPAVNLPLLTWTAGDTAVTHNVYVGTSPELTAANLVAPGQPVAMYYHAAGLEPGVTYYWRVDEVDATGIVYEGVVWNFTAEPVTAWAPKPADGGKDVFPSPTLGWTAGKGAAEHQVFLSSNRFDVIISAATADKGKTAETKLATGLLASGTTYYWRVDEIQLDGTAIKGLIWSFTTAEAVEKKIVRQWWLNIPGTAISDLTGSADYPSNASGAELLDAFEGPVDWADNYGSRLYGWLTPPASGEYTFWVASDDASELRLSADTDPANANVIAKVPGWTNSRIWDKYPEQKSVAIALQAGQKYYIEALMKEGGGGDNVAVSWQGPGIAAQEIISAQYVNTFAVAPLEAPGASIVWVSFHGADDAPSNGAKGVGFTEAPDKAYTDLLKANGYDVVRYIQTGTPDASILSAADLVIVSRSVNSGSFGSAAATRWNNIAAPMINLNGYTIRKNRLGFSTGNTIPDTTGNITLTVADPNHPIFAGIALTDGTMTNPFAGVVVYPTDGTLARGISIVTDPANENGTVLATVSAAGNGPAGAMVIAEWPAGVTVTHDGGAGTDTLAGRRLVFLTGAREAASGKSSETAGMYDLHEDGATMFLNAVKYMLP